MHEKSTRPLRVGFIGSGFIARFHLQAFLGVRDATISGVFSPTPAHREALAAEAQSLGLGPCRAYPSVESMLRSGEVDAVWILGPNSTRLEHMRTIHREVKAGRASLRGVACEKPLARNLAEAREMLRLAEDASLNHGYLENQLFSTAVRRGREILWRRAAPIAGRPYLARASEEHSGPHAPWFWRGGEQGGGVLSDMMCHSIEVARYLLTEPGRDRDSLRPLSANATIATLKWTRPEYAARLKEATGVDYTRRPVEDFARGTLTLEDEAGRKLVIEATTSWSYVGPGLRIQLELLGPEYAMEYSTLNSGLRVFLSRHVTREAGEDLVEKQNAEQGLMPVLEDEAASYGYTLEDRHMVGCFLRGERPEETFRDGVAVVELLMALYRSAETGRTVALPDAELEEYVPAVARGEYRG
ncbi:dehydrogenase [Rubrobacter xylanophilus]|uniref:Dehydrogenase n=1 Tax=Rubrobacter xylanophilus TaxID=49319 RepID=A0A510HLS8_9ACTN|nr:Gfo/Idh/MocA family oxidoreductase [Rubrobacter xylanophilus]BBL80912.1 dehydrogenase [Rubrobacter xylanophilus]